MVRINYCPSCGNELSRGSFICPSCNLDIEELFAKGCLLASNDRNNSIELFDGNVGNLVINCFDNRNIEGDILDNPNANVRSGDEIIIIVPENANEDELVINLDDLGIDVENMEDNINIVIQVEGMEGCVDAAVDEDDFLDEANEWYFNDDSYGIVYYEFPYQGR